MWDYLEQDVRGVMKQHHQSANANVVSTVGETEQEDGGQMVNHLFFEILACKQEQSAQWSKMTMHQQKNLNSCNNSHLLTMCSVKFLIKPELQATRHEMWPGWSRLITYMMLSKGCCSLETQDWISCVNYTSTNKLMLSSSPSSWRLQRSVGAESRKNPTLACSTSNELSPWAMDANIIHRLREVIHK